MDNKKTCSHREWYIFIIVNTTSSLSLTTSILGNVALDIARIVVKPIEELETTDITEQAIHLLKRSTVSQVHIFGRRGPVQAAFTTKELREMFDIPNCTIFMSKADLTNLSAVCLEEMKTSRIRSRMMALMQSKSVLLEESHIQEALLSNPENTNKKQVYFHFFAAPVKYLAKSEDSSILDQIEFDRMRLVGPVNQQLAVRSGEHFVLKNCGVVLESVGYLQKRISGFPQDKSGAVSHIQGRVLDLLTQEPLGGVYVSGWFKRGASGVIATNVWDSQETVFEMFVDWYNGIWMPSKFRGLEDYLSSVCGKFISWSDWQLIEHAEETRVSEVKPREKFVSILEMLNKL